MWLFDWLKNTSKMGKSCWSIDCINRFGKKFSSNKRTFHGIIWAKKPLNSSFRRFFLSQCDWFGAKVLILMLLCFCCWMTSVIWSSVTSELCESMICTFCCIACWSVQCKTLFMLLVQRCNLLLHGQEVYSFIYLSMNPFNNGAGQWLVDLTLFNLF